MLLKIQSAIRIVCCFALALMSFIVLMQVVNRNIFGGSFKWVEELAGMCMIWVTFLGASLASSLGAHTRIELFVTLFPKKISDLIFAIGDVVCALFSLSLSYYSIPLILANIHTMSPAMKISLSINYIVFAVATVLMFIFYIIKAKEDFTKVHSNN